MGRTAWVWAGAAGAGRNADGGGGGCVCAGGVGRGVCEQAEVVREGAGAAGNLERGCRGLRRREGRG